MHNHPNQVTDTVEQERGKLLNYIKKQVRNVDDAEDILQDVFYEFAESHFLLRPIEQVTSWLYTVARNRISDRFRKKKHVAESDLETQLAEESGALLDGWLETAADPEFELTRLMVLEALEVAIAALPEKQRQAFVRHELDGVSFQELSKETGEPVNTLISRKRYAVVALRERMRALYLEFIHD